MKICFDVSQTGAGKAGCGFYSHAMVQAMLELAPEHRYFLFPSFGDFYFDALMPVRNPYPGRNVRYGPRHLTREYARGFWNDTQLEAVLGQPEIVHSNNFWCPLQLKSSRLVYTFYDMGFTVDPDWTTETNRIGCFDGVFRSAMAADWVVAISEASRAHYLKIFPHFPADRVRVIYPCSRFIENSSKGRRPKTLIDITSGKFWLNVGTIEPRKNQYRLAESYASYLKKGGEAMPLVLVGGQGWLMDNFEKQVKTLGIENHVVMTGYVSDDELIWLYRNCYANMYPSLFEGFGLPVLEGMQFGAATITSDNSSLPEVAGSAAVLLNAEDTEAWADTMFRLSRDPAERHRLSMLATAQAERFEWKQSALALLDLYKEAVHSPKRSNLK